VPDKPPILFISQYGRPGDYDPLARPVAPPIKAEVTCQQRSLPPGAPADLPRGATGDLDRAASRIERARELGEEVVARGVDHPTAMLANEGRDVLASGLQRPHRRHLVASHKAAVASHVTAQDSGELAFDDVRMHGAPS
jgi:hypothetical protein